MQKLPNQSDTLTVVLGFGKASEFMASMANFWTVFSSNLLFVSPEDDKCPGPVKQVAVGKSSRFGPDNNARIQLAFREAAKWTGSHVWIHEWDSLAVLLDHSMLPPPGGVTVHWRRSDKPLTRYRAPYFPWFPQLWTIEGVRRVSKALDALPITAERGWPDRFLGAAMMDAKIPVKHMPDFYGEHTIREASTVSRARRAGATWIHGIKSEAVLRGV